ncbi:hypothetical protein JTE90_016627, partial [Oedothorax gibbosus]
SKAAYVLVYQRRDSVHSHPSRAVSAALGAPGSSPDEENASSSDEDCSMDVN